MKGFFTDGINLVPLIRRLSVTPYTICLFVTHIYGFFVRIYMRICKIMVIYLGIKTPQSRKERIYTWQKNACISCSRNDCKYTWEKSARISCHNFETNGQPYILACGRIRFLLELSGKGQWIRQILLRWMRC